MNPLNENNLTEQTLINWLKAQGYDHIYGPDINPGQLRAERDDFRSVVLRDRLSGAVRRFNPSLPAEQAEMVVKEMVNYSHDELILGNKEVYAWLANGKKVTFRERGEEKTEFVKFIDFTVPSANDFVVVNQFTVKGVDALCRLDVVIFVNGLPLAVFELKNPVSQSATIGEAYRQVERYKKEIPKLFLYNQIIGLSDVHQARHGTISSSWERYGTWKGIDTPAVTVKDASQLEILTKGLFDKSRFLDVVQNFIVFEADGDGDVVTYTKKMCLYHQYYGVNATVESTLRSVQGEQDRKIGVFWHTQGSGKSLSMVFYVNKTKNIEELRSPAYVFLTDREDLDDQLHKTFQRTGYGYLAKRADSIKDLQKKLQHIGSELIFTTVQKFQDDPDDVVVLSERDNLIVIADEAHRSQYSIFAGILRKALPNASFLGVTGTPIALDDRVTQKEFGPIVSSYKIGQSVDDGATVRIYYEGRLVPLHLADKFIDSKFDDILGEIMVEEKVKARKEWVVLEEVVGAQSRIDEVAKDIVHHFNNRPIEGKAMVVTMSRRIAVSMYKAIQALSGAPECAVIISNSDEFKNDIQPERNVKQLEKRFKKTNDPLKIAIVCDMWLTGFDVPSMHTMYLDKPLKNHGLMQAIARVNRVYKDKPGGLIVDYIGIAENLKKALAIYDSDIQDHTLLPLEEIVLRMKQLHSEALGFLHGIDLKGWRNLSGTELTALLQKCVNEVISHDGRLSDEHKMRFIGIVNHLSRLHALVMPSEAGMDILTDVQLLQAVKHSINKQTVVPKTVFPEETESAIRSLVHGAVAAEGVVDLFGTNGESKSISIFDKKFVEEIKKVRFQNFAVDAVRKLLNQEISTRMRMNKARYETMLTLLNDLIEQYENNVISSTEIIKRLLEIAEEIKQLDEESNLLGLSPEEITFYDTLQTDPDLKHAGVDIKEFVKELTKRIRRDLTIDWTNNETIKARVRQNVRLLLFQKGIIETLQTERLINLIYAETVRVYREYSIQST